MTLEKTLAEQLERIEALQHNEIAMGASAGDVTLPEDLRDERLAQLRRAVTRLEADRSRIVARYDREIAARESEIAELQRMTGLDIVKRAGGASVRPRPRARRD